MRRRYDILGNFISPIYFEESDLNCFCISLLGTTSVFVFTDESLKDLTFSLIQSDYRELFDSEGYETVISKKHIVKITKVKDDL